MINKRGCYSSGHDNDIYEMKGIGYENELVTWYKYKILNNNYSYACIHNYNYYMYIYVEMMV